VNLPNANLERWMRPVQVVGVVGAVGTLVAAYDAVHCWTEPGRWWVSRLASVVVALACLGFVSFALMWNVLDFSMCY